MRQGLLWAVLGVSAIAAALSEFFLFRMFTPPDAEAGIIGAAWAAMPFLGAAGMAALVRRRQGALVTELVALLLASVVGVSMLSNMADQRDTAQQQARDAVQPGEDPHSGPAGMRKSGADAGAMITDVFSVLVVVVVPLAQLATVVIPTLLGYGVSALVGTRKDGVTEGRVGANGRASFA